MDSLHSNASPFKDLTAIADTEKQNSDDFDKSSGGFSDRVGLHGKEANASRKFEHKIGILDVYIHQARDIHNICIYRKQDVYAKLYLTGDPGHTVSTKIVNGGGKNPVFDENLQLHVGTIESSLKCEIWMLSRVRNYLEDQMLGFALVPLSDVLIKNGRLEKEFSLSSTDLFHSPAGFVLLSLSYAGASPEVMAIPQLPSDLAADITQQESEIGELVPNEFHKIEFPDPIIANENQMMVSEYFGIATSDNTENSERLISSDTDKQHDSKVIVHVLESNSADSSDSMPLQKHDSSHSSLSTNGSPSVSLPVSSRSSDSQVAVRSPNHEMDVSDSENGTLDRPSGEAVLKPLVSVSIEPEEKVVQQDIVDMYMKSMQQFTESLAKMKLPTELDTEQGKPGNSSSGQKLQSSKSTGSRVFYGSRAFF
ncbi:hypothetical protein Nepgr_026222 [Nepenthes gracilis]|uniref:C2 domain-containing protein n=1 Tax=Nepenthes gracilis TaxID=150966 RepID=A0AAD3T8N3_NEPGR|nr:hypothetical protein Nepgr_026222 [Nepenthes gracilis]